MRGSPPEATSPVPAAGPPVEWGLIYLIARVFYGMRSRTEEALRPHSLTPMQFTILAGMERWEGVSSAELSRRFEVTPQTMGEMIANLERHGLITRRQDPRNRRALKLDLTAAGREALSASAAEIARLDAELVSGLDQAAVGDLRRGLEALFGKLGLKPD